MDNKYVKKMIYMTIILFLFVVISFVFAKKCTSDFKREQNLEQQQIFEQASRYDKQFSDNETNQSSQVNEHKRDISQYIDENTMNIEQYGQINNPDYSQDDNSTVKQSDKPKTVELYKLSDNYVQKGYSIVKDFEINSAKFAIVSKKSDYQSEYTKSIKKKYYIYKYIGNKLYETAYIIDVSIPKDKEGNEADVFTINVNGNTVEININILSNTSRQYTKQRLLSSPLTGANVLDVVIETKTIES